MKQEDIKPLSKQIQEILTAVREAFSEEVSACMGHNGMYQTAHIDGEHEFMLTLTAKLLAMDRNRPCTVTLYTDEPNNITLQTFMKEHGITAQHMSMCMICYTGTRGALEEMILDVFKDDDLINDIKD